MNSIVIYARNGWTLTSFGNGWGYLLECSTTRQSVLFQDDAARQFGADIMDDAGWLHDKAEERFAADLEAAYAPEGEAMTGQLMNALWRCARNHARAQMKEQGIKVQYVEPRQLHPAADAPLKQNWQRFLEEAQALCARADIRTNEKNGSSRNQRLPLCRIPVRKWRPINADRLRTSEHRWTNLGRTASKPKGRRL